MLTRALKILCFVGIEKFTSVGFLVLLIMRICDSERFTIFFVIEFSLSYIHQSVKLGTECGCDIVMCVMCVMCVSVVDV
jgi:hypothetical protein